MKELNKLPTYIKGFDLIAEGGLPKGRSTLVSGTPGSAKTTFACQFLVKGITKSNENTVFVTFEENPEDIRLNMSNFGWDIAKWEKEGKWLFVDCSASLGEYIINVGNFDLSGLISRIIYAVNKNSASRLSIDSIGSLFNQFENSGLIRNSFLKLFFELKKNNVTVIITTERDDENGKISRNGEEEFAADNVIILRNIKNEANRRRTIEILKFRGTSHHKGEFAFTINPSKGMVVLPPLFDLKLTPSSSNIRIQTGITELDKMTGGGVYQDSIILINGATGTGKTLIASHFVSAAENNEKTILFAFEESYEQIIRNTNSWGFNFEAMVDSGLLQIKSIYPEATTLEDHLEILKETVETHKPARIVVDSLTALERIAGPIGFREFSVQLISYIKQAEISGMFTSTTSTLWGSTSITEKHISTLTDTIILLRYLEYYGETKRGISVLKMRGSAHDKNIREFYIDGKGMHIGEVFKNVTGILSGSITHSLNKEVK
jgi:circadian clock protein KaiC